MCAWEGWGGIQKTRHSKRGEAKWFAKRREITRSESLYNQASVSLVYTCSNYVVRIFSVLLKMTLLLHYEYSMVSPKGDANSIGKRRQVLASEASVALPLLSQHEDVCFRQELYILYLRWPVMSSQPLHFT